MSTATKKKAKVQKPKHEIDAATLRAVRIFSNAKAQISILKDRANRMEAIIREGLEGAEIGTVDGLKVVELVWSSNPYYSKEILLERFPEAEAAAKKVTNYNYVKVV